MRGTLGSWLIVAGVVLVIAGALAKAGWLGWFGHLPGDIRIERGGSRFYFPLTSMILVSVVLSVCVNVVRRFL